MSSSLVPLIAMTLALSLFGCADSPEPAGSDDASEDDVTAALVRDVAAVDFEVRIRGKVTAGDTVAAPAKVAKVVKSMKAKTGHAIGACGSARSDVMTFRDAAGATLGTVEYRCAAGTLHIEKSNRDVSVLIETAAIAAVQAEPRVPADVVFGVDAIEITKPMTSKKVTITSATELHALLGTMDLEALDPNAPQSKCVPGFIVHFQSKRQDVAMTSFLCGSGTPPASTRGEFSYGPSATTMKYAGATTLDPRAIVKAFDRP